MKKPVTEKEEVVNTELDVAVEEKVEEVVSTELDVTIDEPKQEVIEVSDKKATKNKKKSSANQMLEWKKDGWKAFICLLPAMAILLLFTFYPIINTFIISFFPDYDYLSGSFGEFGVAETYGKILSDPVFWRAMLNTAVMVFVSVPLSIIIALLITVLLNSIKVLQGFFQVIFFLPYVTNGIAFGIVFATIFSPEDYGLINGVLNILVNWTGDGKDIPYWAGILVITINGIWSGLAFKIMVFLSGIQGIDKQYYQAAQVDSTPKWRVFTKITVPLLSPMILYITITSLMGAFKSYSSVVSLFGEGMGTLEADGSGRFITAVGYIYEYFNQVTGGGMGEMLPIAAAAALILFVFIMIITFVQMWANSKKVHY